MNKKFKWNQKFEKTLVYRSVGLADTMKSVGFLHFSLIKIISELAPGSRLAWSVLFVTPGPVSHINSSVQKFNSSRSQQQHAQINIIEICENTIIFKSVSLLPINKGVVSLIWIHLMTHRVSVDLRRNCIFR